MSSSPLRNNAASSGTPPTVPSTWVRIPGDWHTHPIKGSEKIHGCPRFQDGKFNPARGPSGSVDGLGDISRAITDARAGYLIDADGFIFRWNYPPDQPGSEETNNITHWKREGNSACFERKGLWEPYL